MASNVDCSDDDRFDRFDDFGPTNMMGGRSSTTMIDWDDKEQCRCIAACIVRATYVLDKDRIKNRVGSQALAPAWSENFNLECMKVLEDVARRFQSGKSIFGAIYKKKQEDALCHPSAPHYIVAFRGTMLGHPTTAIQDIKHDLRILNNNLMGSKWSQQAHEAVKELLDDINCRNCVVWLAGHSLGASLALEVGRTAVLDQNLKLPTFLFNPPQVSSEPFINLLQPTGVVKKELYFTRSCVKACLGRLIFRPHRERMEELFQKMSSWEPKLYVHENDLICHGYIDYFEQRQQLEERLHGVARSAITLSYRDMFWSMFSLEKERRYLLPSAELCKNKGTNNDGEGLGHRLKQRRSAHALEQWWKPDVSLDVKAYRYPGPRA